MLEYIFWLFFREVGDALDISCVETFLLTCSVFLRSLSKKALQQLCDTREKPAGVEHVARRSPSRVEVRMLGQSDAKTMNAERLDRLLQTGLYEVRRAGARNFCNFCCLRKKRFTDR